ncbi:MAG TPA: hypothetical protein VEK57_08385 [Thermoanaerobaculia bacterium]|nr:hypothetical protein [Thermoanaerobaculia bacterium]
MIRSRGMDVGSSGYRTFGHLRLELRCDFAAVRFAPLRPRGFELSVFAIIHLKRT